MKGKRYPEGFKIKSVKQQASAVI